MKIIFDKYRCPACETSDTFEVRHEPTGWLACRGFTSADGYDDFFYGHCACGYNLNLSGAIMKEYGTQEHDGRWSGPYPCLALERAFIEPHPTKPEKEILTYDYECARARRAKRIVEVLKGRLTDEARRD